MIYEMRFYDSKKDWYREDTQYILAWETDDEAPVNDGKIRGKLLSCLCFDGPVFEVPDGIDTIAEYAFVKPEWDLFESRIKTLVIPASVEKIEEEAFCFTDISEIIIHPDSPAGVVIGNGIYTKDEKTLLWVLGTNEKREFTVPDGVERIAAGVIDDHKVRTFIFPASVKEICCCEREIYNDKVVIKAPKDSYAEKFAADHNLKFRKA